MAISATFQYLAIFRISGFFHRQTIAMLMQSRFWDFFKHFEVQSRKNPFLIILSSYSLFQIPILPLFKVLSFFLILCLFLQHQVFFFSVHFLVLTCHKSILFSIFLFQNTQKTTNRKNKKVTKLKFEGKISGRADFAFSANAHTQTLYIYEHEIFRTK